MSLSNSALRHRARGVWSAIPSYIALSLSLSLSCMMIIYTIIEYE